MLHFRLAALVAALCLPPAAARAEDRVVIAAPDGFLFVRCVDSGGAALCEFLAATDDRLRCVALDADGAPLAVATAFPRSGAALFDQLDHATVATMICD